MSIYYNVIVAELKRFTDSQFQRLPYLLVIGSFELFFLIPSAARYSCTARKVFARQTARK